MQPLKKRANELIQSIDNSIKLLNIESKRLELDAIDRQLADSEVWSNIGRAQALSQQSSKLRNMVEPWERLSTQSRDILELMEIGDDSMTKEFDEQLCALESELAERKKELLFQGEFDSHNAILRISAGAGGTDAQDWAER